MDGQRPSSDLEPDATPLSYFFQAMEHHVAFLDLFCPVLSSVSRSLAHVWLR